MNKLNTRHGLAVILLIAALNYGVSMGWGLPAGHTSESVGTWPVDTLAPVTPLTEAYYRFSRQGTDPVLYPLFHYVVLAGAYGPYVGYELLTGGLENPTAEYPYGVTNPGVFFSSLTIIARLVSWLMALGCVGLVYWMVSRAYGTSAAKPAALAVALLAPIAYYGSTSNLDVPYVFWVVASLALLVLASGTGRMSHFLACGATAGLAVATKDQAYGFFLAFPLLIAWLEYPRRQRVVKALFSRPVIGWCMAVIVTYAFANNLVLGGWGGFMNHLQFLQTFYAANFTSLQAEQSMAGTVLDSLVVVGRTLGPGMALFSIYGTLAAFRRARFTSTALVASAASYFLFVVLPTTVIPRYLIGVMLVALVFAAVGVVKAFERQSRIPRVVAQVFVVLSFSWLLIGSVNLNATLLLDARYSMERFMREQVPPTATIESQTQVRYLPRTEQPDQYQIVGNSFDAVSYGLVADVLNPAALAKRAPDYVLILSKSGLSGDPERVGSPAVREYFRALQAGELSYEPVVEFATPTLLWYRQVTSGTQPWIMLLRRRD